jgi:mannose-1-phosphate guanylyltransferase/mannose-6-phosphate isomerase
VAIYPVVLSGGTGTRLWPLSRAAYPKQFIRFFGEEQPSLLVATLRRLSGQTDFAGPIVVGSRDHRFLLRAECAAAEIEPQLIVLEPEPRNTAPAVPAAAHLIAGDATAVLWVMPSDHAIGETAELLAAVRQAAEIAARGKLVLFGITPTEPHTGYGYIARGDALDSGGAFRVARFTEKPDSQTARRYCECSTYLWNSGMFVLHAATFLEELDRFNPDIAIAARDSVRNAKAQSGFLTLDAESFAMSPSVSVDYAVMERTEKAAVIPLAARWSDVGSWNALWEIGDKDSAGNAVQGDAILTDTSTTLVHSGRSLVATLGVSGLVIVDTPDALLVADRRRSEEVGSIIAQLRGRSRKEHGQHARLHHAWGYSEVLSERGSFQVKLLHINPGGRIWRDLSHRLPASWTVVKGMAQVTVGEGVCLVRADEGVCIASTWESVENPGEGPLELVEVTVSRDVDPG